MTEEAIKLLVGLGVGGVVGGIALWMLSKQGDRHDASMKEIRDELVGIREDFAAAAQKNNDWLVLIHSRMGSLGADSIPPPDEQPPVRHRLRTAPSGVPIKRKEG